MSYAKFIEEAARDRMQLQKDIAAIIEAYEKKYVGMTIDGLALVRGCYNLPIIDTTIKLPEYL